MDENEKKAFIGASFANAFMYVGASAAIAYVCKELKTPWPLLALALIPGHRISTNSSNDNDKEETPNE